MEYSLIIPLLPLPTNMSPLPSSANPAAPLSEINELFIGWPESAYSPIVYPLATYICACAGLGRDREIKNPCRTNIFLNVFVLIVLYLLRLSGEDEADAVVAARIIRGGSGVEVIRSPFVRAPRRNDMAEVRERAGAQVVVGLQDVTVAADG